MQKPSGFDQAAASLYYEPLALGGHVCIIKGVEETKSKSGKDMYKVALDIAAGDPQAGYYQEKFNNDTREDKKWPCVTYVVITDNEGNCSKNCARFVTSVEESNPGFSFPWDNAAFLKGKKVGVVFGEEEYMAKEGKIKRATKPFWFRSADKAVDAPIPDLKPYQRPMTSASRVTTFADISNDDIPF